jgi:hypothetical protein
MLVPNAERAQVDIRKLTHYLLNPDHATGSDKARIWFSALGITAEDAGRLSSYLLDAVRTNAAILGIRDHWGQRYTVDFLLEWNGRRAIIRTGWIIADDSDIPRLTTAYPR